MDRKTLILRADIFRLILTAGVVMLILSAPPLPLGDDAPQALMMIFGLSAAVFLLGTAEVFRDNAAQTAMPQIVDKADLETANGQLWSIEQIMGQFIGPPLAGLLIAMAVPVPFVVDALTFALATVLVWCVTMRSVPMAPTQAFWTQFREGARWMAGHKVILTFAIMLSVLNFVTFGSLTVLVLMSQEVLDLDAAGYGLLLSAGAGGAVLGGLIGPKIAVKLGGRDTVLFALLMFTPAFLAVGLSASAILTGFALMVLWGSGMVWNVVTVSLRQRVIPAELLGRVNSIYRFFGWGSIPLGALSMGALVAWMEPSLGREAALRLPFLIASGVSAALLGYALLALKRSEIDRA